MVPKTALPGIAHLHLMMKMIEDFSFTACPERSDEKLFGAIAGQSVYYNFRRQMLQTGDEEIQIFFLRVDRKKPFFIIFGEICAS